MEMKIYDYLGAGGVIAQDIINKIGDEQKVTLRINSPGGVVSEALALHNYLVDSGKDVTVYVDGYAASAASVLMMAGSRVVVYPSSIIMLHKPLQVSVGNADEMRKTAEVLDIHEDAILKIYMRRAKCSEEELRGMLHDETWILGERAVELGLADECQDEEENPQSVAAMFRFAQINQKLLEEQMSKTETRKEIAAVRDELAEKVAVLETGAAEITAMLETAQATIAEITAERDTMAAAMAEMKSEAEKIRAEYEAKVLDITQAHEAATADLSKKIEAITEGLKNPGMADAAMVAASLQEAPALVDAEADVAEKAAMGVVEDTAPKSLMEQMEAMPFGPERTAFYASNKKKILAELEASNANK